MKWAQGAKFSLIERFFSASGILIDDIMALVVMDGLWIESLSDWSKIWLHLCLFPFWRRQTLQSRTKIFIQKPIAVGSCTESFVQTVFDKVCQHLQSLSRTLIRNAHGYLQMRARLADIEKQKELGLVSEIFGMLWVSDLLYGSIEFIFMVLCTSKVALFL